MKKKSLNLSKKLLLSKARISDLGTEQSGNVMGGRPTGGGISCMQSCYNTWCQATCANSNCDTRLCPDPVTLAIDCI